VSTKLNFVNTQRGRDGAVRYWYFRRDGRRWRLPGNPYTDSEAAAEYWRLHRETDRGTPHVVGAAERHAAGSFGRLVRDYLASGSFRDKKHSTQAEYRRVLEKLAEVHGPKPVRLMERRHIRRMRDERADTPGAANTIVRTLKLLLTFAVEDGLIAANPAARLKLLKVGEWRAWTDEECAAFETRWAAGSMERRAYLLAISTGQRKGDLVAMTRAHRKDGAIRVVQGKTGEELWIPEHRQLAAELATGDHMSLLTTSQGKAFDPVYFGAWFADAIYKAGLPDDCVLHGLRKTAARRLAEAGCTEDQIKAVTGHATSRMVSHYTKGANQKRLAKAAILKLERTTDEP
jgi:integrase